MAAFTLFWGGGAGGAKKISIDFLLLQQTARCYGLLVDSHFLHFLTRSCQTGLENHCYLYILTPYCIAYHRCKSRLLFLVNGQLAHLSAQAAASVQMRPLSAFSHHTAQGTPLATRYSQAILCNQQQFSWSHNYWMVWTEVSNTKNLHFGSFFHLIFIIGPSIFRKTQKPILSFK